MKVPLVIAGRKAWNYDSILDTINSSPHTHYLGFVPEAERVALMQNAELFVFPSLYEGFGFPVLEAMAAGTPVACSNRGALSEISGPALRLSALDAVSMSAELAEWLADSVRRDSVRNEGKEWVRQFSWDVCVEKHLEVYRKVIDE
jgi:glycosyltransferase involved in cell wall biosynthesis